LSSAKKTKKRTIKKKSAARKTKKTSALNGSKKKKGLSPFEAVWTFLLRVPRGKVITYGELSRLIDGRLSPLAVGWALRAAPDGALPWHRVVSASGAISTNAEHPGLQRELLEAEGVRFVGSVVDLDRHACNIEVVRGAASAKNVRKPRGRPTRR
jgi:methylated-DNA-protein-cysteine methyltransferase-like protein